MSLALCALTQAVCLLMFQIATKTVTVVHSTGSHIQRVFTFFEQWEQNDNLNIAVLKKKHRHLCPASFLTWIQILCIIKLLQFISLPYVYLTHGELNHSIHIMT